MFLSYQGRDYLWFVTGLKLCDHHCLHGTPSSVNQWIKARATHTFVHILRPEDKPMNVTLRATFRITCTWKKISFFFCVQNSLSEYCLRLRLRVSSITLFTDELYVTRSHWWLIYIELRFNVSSQHWYILYDKDADSQIGRITIRWQSLMWWCYTVVVNKLLPQTLWIFVICPPCC